MSKTTRWAAPLALTRGLLVGLCVCWPSYTSAASTQRDPSQDQAQTADAVETIRLAEQGDVGAQFLLGLMYEHGRGVPQDETEAVRWIRLGADQGYWGAQYNLGLMYEDGRGVPQDDAEAVRWFRLAAEQGNGFAQVWLAGEYYYGKGVPQDYVAAHMWLNLAAAQSSGDDREGRAKLRDHVATRMTPEQIAEAQRLAREWKPTVQP